ncbi:hypothetical protein HNQ07_001057 [Deinococcus metalli]|uniref:Uncharacterized protein n=1 Tax=Deinococcus metalli TaxID=1141878 RepID=A0A7W8KCU2_9DEIO|nr:hypothetical protein [Deinococcus metalli]MBB5375600.1 hypothetical protein [Deinococcus metalli]GHF38483.1 hypothetical protein GCM10017781_14010 [Deinococcus metalli]
MNVGWTAGQHSTNLAALLGEDDVLYRAAQGLLCLRATPGRSQRLIPMVVRRAGRFEVLGRLGQTLRVPPLALGLDAELDQVAHLRSSRTTPLGVESLFDGRVLDADLLYEVESDAVAALTIPVGAVARALNARDRARSRPAWRWPWDRAAFLSDPQAEREVKSALGALRRAAGDVQLTRRDNGARESGDLRHVH